MARDTREKNSNWTTFQDSTNTHWTDSYYLRSHTALLMDIRDELQTLNRLLGCPNFTGIPHTLNHIMQNTKKRKYTKRVP
jgi:hypothetical protein